MFDHVAVCVSDLDASSRFYGLGLKTLGFGEPYTDGENFEWEDFVFGSPLGRPVTRGLHVAFVAPSREAVDEWWRVLAAAGYTSDGEPGERPQYSPTYYGGFVLDPDGNSVEAIHAEDPRPGDNIVDHIWIGVSDLDATRRFYEAINPILSFRIASAGPERLHVVGGGRSFALVHDGRSPTENLHLAFGVEDNATVDEFHRVAVAAGYTSNGPPGERPVYHAGYYGAFVFDPDGNNVEAVCHNR